MLSCAGCSTRPFAHPRKSPARGSRSSRATEAIRRAVALEDLVEADAAQVRATPAQASARWAVLEISSDVAARAEQAFPVEPVRTLDAVHLASALLLRHLVPDLRVVSTDSRIRTNASQLGFEIFPAS